MEGRSGKGLGGESGARTTGTERIPMVVRLGALMLEVRLVMLTADALMSITQGAVVSPTSEVRLETSRMEEMFAGMVMLFSGITAGSGMSIISVEFIMLVIS